MKKKKDLKRANYHGFIYRPESFDVFFGKLLEAKDLIDYWNEKRFTIKDFGDMRYRLITYWTEIGLIDDDRDKQQKWRRFSILDFIWLHIIKELREFGLSNEKIAKTKKHLFSPIKGQKERAPLIEAYLINAFVRNTPCYLLVFNNGFCDLGAQDEIEFSKSLGMIEANYISISLNKILQKLYTSRNLSSKYAFKFALSDDEEEVLRRIRQGNYKSVEVHLKNGKIERINSTEITEKKKIIDLINEVKHQEIVIKVQDGKPIHVTRTEKVKVGDR